MSTFRARLRVPKRTLWLGCEVKEVEIRSSQTTGGSYALLRFTNCPFVTTWTPFYQREAERILYEREICTPVTIEKGMQLNLDVRWELVPEIGLAPRCHILMDSVLRAQA
jgi:hypothetical protein